jgi:mutator protein MutT
VAENLAAQPLPGCQLAASAVLIRDSHVLLVRRDGGANAGLWSLPGGHIEPGETAECAARREVEEETGLRPGALRYLETVPVTAGTAHYQIAVFVAVAPNDTPVAAGDAAAATFHAMAGLQALPMTAGTAAVICRAAAALSRYASGTPQTAGTALHDEP